MTIETLKQLIEIEFDRSETISQFKSEVFRLIDLYEQDKDWEPILEYRAPINYSEPDEVMYGEICPCNPKNGGSGICGCVIGNKMVPNPKKYGSPITNFGTTSTGGVINPMKG